ncbi:MAG: sugar phosphate isomerase/epimerase family protein [Mycetocola sp.]
MSPNTARIASAPISWGVSEVPGWGVQLSPERVLSEMASLGFDATEFGPDGFLPDAPAEKAATLAAHGLSAVGSFVPLVLHRAEVDPLPRVQQEIEAYAAAGAHTLVLCAVTGEDGYNDTRAALSPEQWDTLFSNLNTISALAAQSGVTAVLHPHVGSVIETAADVTAVVNGSTIPFCFDTGHLMIGGTDPVEFAVTHAARIAHTHLKDVSLARMEQVRSGELSYYDACVQGLYTPLGQGDINISAIVTSLIGAGYTGWFVLEQDTIVGTEPAQGEGPISDARASVTYLRDLISSIPETEK